MSRVVLVAQHNLPTAAGLFRLSYFKFGEKGQRVFALHTLGNGERTTTVRLRIQYACLYGTSLNAVDCDCGYQMRRAMQIAASDPSVLLLYFYDHEAEGLGLDAKVLYTKREKETGQSFSQLLKRDNIPFLPDVLWTIVPILSELRVGKRIVLMTNNLNKVEQLRAHGAEIVSIEKDWDAAGDGKAD